MTLSTLPKRPGVGARRAGYLLAALVNAVILYVANVWPGWQALPFLTDDMTAVMPWVNASLVVSIAANLVYVVADPRWLKALGDLITSTVGLVALLRVWQVFPFDFADYAFDWAVLVRVALAVGIGGSVIAAVAAVVSLIRSIRTI
jgi:hypothetical protein